MAITIVAPSEISKYITTPPMRSDMWMHLHTHHLRLVIIEWLDRQPDKEMAVGSVDKYHALVGTQARLDSQASEAEHQGVSLVLDD